MHPIKQRRVLIPARRHVERQDQKDELSTEGFLIVASFAWLRDFAFWGVSGDVLCFEQVDCDAFRGRRRYPRGCCRGTSPSPQRQSEPRPRIVPLYMVFVCLLCLFKPFFSLVELRLVLKCPLYKLGFAWKVPLADPPGLTHKCLNPAVSKGCLQFKAILDDIIECDVVYKKYFQILKSLFGKCAK